MVNATGSLDFAREDEDEIIDTAALPGALRGERNEAVLRLLSSESCLNRPAESIR